MTNRTLEELAAMTMTEHLAVERQRLIERTEKQLDDTMDFFSRQREIVQREIASYRR